MGLRWSLSIWSRRLARSEGKAKVEEDQRVSRSHLESASLMWQGTTACFAEIARLHRGSPLRSRRVYTPPSSLDRQRCPVLRFATGIWPVYGRFVPSCSACYRSRSANQHGHGQQKRIDAGAHSRFPDCCDGNCPANLREWVRANCGRCTERRRQYASPVICCPPFIPYRASRTSCGRRHCQQPADPQRPGKKELGQEAWLIGQSETARSYRNSEGAAVGSNTRAQASRPPPRIR